MKVPVVPFLVPPTDAVSHGGWHVSTPDGERPLPPEIAYWDYQTTLDLVAAVSVDRTLISETCALAPDTGFEVLVTAHSDHTRTQRPVARIEVPLHDHFDLAVGFTLPGFELGGRLTLDTLLVVTDPKPTAKFAPSRPGSIIWSARQRTQLEGIGAQFPTDSADFTLTRGGRSAAGWELTIDASDPDALFMAAVRLTLNSGNPAIVKMMEGGRDERSAQLRRTLTWDVTRQLVLVALSLDEVVTADFDQGAVSVTGVLRNLLAAVWPKDDPIIVRNWLASNPPRIELTLQHHCGLLS